jgi:hypothetical protein
MEFDLVIGFHVNILIFCSPPDIELSFEPHLAYNPSARNT